LQDFINVKGGFFGKTKSVVSSLPSISDSNPYCINIKESNVATPSEPTGEKRVSILNKLKNFPLGAQNYDSFESMTPTPLKVEHT
jgi:hypothetical protein